MYLVSLIAIKMHPNRLESKVRKEEKVMKAITIEKKEILQKYESGVRVTDLANMHRMSNSTISSKITGISGKLRALYNPVLIISFGKGCFGSFGKHYRFIGV
jgi:DNA-binding NarL/FixJ family response regulator